MNVSHQENEYMNVLPAGDDGEYMEVSPLGSGNSGQKWITTNLSNKGKLHLNHEYNNVSDPKQLQKILDKCHDLEKLYLHKHYEV